MHNWAPLRNGAPASTTWPNEARPAVSSVAAAVPGSAASATAVPGGSQWSAKPLIPTVRHRYVTVPHLPPGRACPAVISADALQLGPHVRLQADHAELLQHRQLVPQHAHQPPAAHPAVPFPDPLQRHTHRLVVVPPPGLVGRRRPTTIWTRSPCPASSTRCGPSSAASNRHSGASSRSGQQIQDLAFLTPRCAPVLPAPARGSLTCAPHAKPHLLRRPAQSWGQGRSCGFLMRHHLPVRVDY